MKRRRSLLSSAEYHVYFPGKTNRTVDSNGLLSSLINQNTSECCLHVPKPPPARPPPSASFPPFPNTRGPLKFRLPAAPRTAPPTYLPSVLFHRRFRKEKSSSSSLSAPSGSLSTQVPSPPMSLHPLLTRGGCSVTKPRMRMR